MCEITKNNFQEKLADVKISLEKAKFISIDLEFSALNILHNVRLFDDNKQRYRKLKEGLSNVIPVQIGVSAFQFNNKTNDYFAEVFTFYVCPPAFADHDKAFYFQASTIRFLTMHNFDFNKFVYYGVPYLNKDDERKLHETLKSGDLAGENCDLYLEFNEIVKTCVPIILTWYKSCKTDDFLDISKLTAKYKQFYQLNYFLHKHLRKRFKNLWTYENNGSFFVKKVSDEELSKLSENYNLDNVFVDKLKGFTHVFDILTALRKPIIGHNLLQDLLILINNFYGPLPESYSQFKELTHQLFPQIFDTKTLFYEIRRSISKEKLPDNSNLECLFKYFKDGLGRHLVFNSSAIVSNLEQKAFHTYHQAGWDSYCAGYIFIRIGYFHLANNCSSTRNFLYSEIVNGLEGFQNCINVIRGDASHMRLDGKDPSSQRPPWLIIQSIKNEPVDVQDLMSVLSSYGFVDIKKMSRKGDRVLVAVDTFRAAREISKTFGANSKLRVQQYSFLKHSPCVRNAIVLGALTISGTVLLWVTHSIIKK